MKDSLNSYLKNDGMKNYKLLEYLKVNNKLENNNYFYILLTIFHE